MLCNKISENPRKGFLQLLARGMNKIKKRIYFRTLRHSSLLLPPVMECFTEKKVHFGTPIMYNVHMNSHAESWSEVLVPHNPFETLSPPIVTVSPPGPSRNFGRFWY